MSLAFDIVTIVAVSAGAFFFLAGTVGLLRFPDALTRLHALTKADNLGLGLVVLGLLPLAGSLRDGLKLICVWLLVLLASATVSQLIARAARRRGTSAMTVASALEIVLAAVVLGVAVWTIAARETFAAVVGFVAYGLLLALVWVRLDAVDVALTEAAIGGGLGGVLMLGAAARLRAGEAPAAAERPERDPAHRGRVALGDGRGRARRRRCCRCPIPRRRSRRQPPRTPRRPGLGNPGHERADGVSRDGHDAGEGRAPARAGRRVVAGARPASGAGARGRATRPIRTACSPSSRGCCRRSGSSSASTSLWVSADHPGGAFQGGTILAAMWLLVMMAGLADAPPVGSRRLRLMLIAGPAVFLTVGLGGLWLGDAFLAYPVAYAKPLILAIEVAMTLTIAVTLGLLMAGAPERSAER